MFESNAGLPIEFPHILGFDLAGTVVECPGCTRLKVGDEVWGDNGKDAISRIRMLFIEPDAIYRTGCYF